LLDDRGDRIGAARLVPPGLVAPHRLVRAAAAFSVESVLHLASPSIRSPSCSSSAVGRIRIEDEHDRARYLFNTSSRFISWLASMVQAASRSGWIEGSAFDSPTAISCLASAA